MERTQLVIQPLDHALQREFAGGIETEIGHSHHPEERTDCDNLAARLPEPDGDDRFQHAEHTEHIRFKLCTRILQAVFFERASLGKASIVHQQIDAPGTLQYRLYAYLNGCLRIDVQRKQFKAARRAAVAWPKPDEAPVTSATRESVMCVYLSPASTAAAMCCTALAAVVTCASAGATLVLGAGCRWNKNATSKAATSRPTPAMRNDPCSASTNAWLIAWCSAAGGSGSRPPSPTWLGRAPPGAILPAIACPPAGPGPLSGALPPSPARARRLCKDP